MEQGIKFVITGDTKGLDQSLKQSEQSLKRYENNIANVQRSINQSSQESQRYQRAIQSLNSQLKNGTISQQQYTRSLEQNRNALDAADRNTIDLQRELQRLQTEYGKTKQRIDTTNRSLDVGGKSLQTFGSRGGSATSAVVSLGQVMQDAPYGIRGVANNIEQLTTQMIFLSRSTGGARGAFTAFLSAMTGPAGILLAVSAVTSAFVFLDQNSRKASKGVDELGKSSDDTKDSVDELRKSVVSLGQAQLGLTLFQNDIVSVQKEEILTLKALLAVARDETKSRQERQRALDKINKDYKQYINNVTLESSSLDKAQKSIEEYNKSLSLENSIKETSESIFQKRRDLIAEETTARIRATEALQKLGDTDIDEERFIADFIARETEKTRKELTGLEQILQDFVSQKLQRVIPGDIAKEITERLQLSPIDIRIRPQIDIRSFDQLVKQAEKGGQGLINAFQQLGEQGGAFQPIISGVEDLIKVTTPAQITFGENLIQMQNAAKAFSTISGAAIDGFTTKLIEDLDTGNEVMNAVIASMIQLGNELLKQLITQAAQALAAKQANTAASIAADTAKATGSAIAGGAESGSATGVGAIVAIPVMIAALVAVVAGAFAAIGGFAQGGIVGGGKFTGDNIPIFVNSGERILTAQDQSLLSQFLRGNYGGTMNRTGDMGPIRVQGVIRGNDIYLSNERSRRNNRRFGSGINN